MSSVPYVAAAPGPAESPLRRTPASVRPPPPGTWPTGTPAPPPDIHDKVIIITATLLCCTQISLSQFCKNRKLIFIH